MYRKRPLEAIYPIADDILPVWHPNMSTAGKEAGPMGTKIVNKKVIMVA